MTWIDNASAFAPTLARLAKESIDGTIPPLSAIILDVGLPDGDGLELCRRIRHTPVTDAGANSADGTGRMDLGFAQLPIIFLTARSDEVDRILGLEMGADDYCAKPFSPRELVARLKAIWRRQTMDSQHLAHHASASSATNAQPIESHSKHPEYSEHIGTHDTIAREYHLASGTWRYEPNTYTLYWHDQPLILSNTERKLMLALLAAPDRVFSREQLLAQVTDYPDHRLARTIDSHIKSIRKILATINSTEVIHTHRGIGYGLYPAPSGL